MTLCFLVLSTDNLCKQFGLRSGLTYRLNYAQLMRRLHLELLYSDEAHPPACAMLETGAMSIQRTNKPLFRTPVDWNLEQIMPSRKRGWHHLVNW